MNTNNEKELMREAAILYYEKKYTQQEIANLMKLSRQTVSKLLNNAIDENIVEIKIHNPQLDCEELANSICEKYKVEKCVVVGVSYSDEALRKIMTVKAAAEYIEKIIKRGNQKIALSWGRTIQAVIEEMPLVSAEGNIVFPLFGATDSEDLYFSSNELVRSMADKIGAKAKYAWFPYMTDNIDDCEILKRFSFYNSVQNLWNNSDIVILGIGNTDVLKIFGKTFGYSEKHVEVVGDIATHFFDNNGKIVNLYQNTLCASVENIKNSREAIAVAYGDGKAAAISAALKTKMINTLIIDEYTAKKILEN